MTDLLLFIVPGVPQGKGRARFVRATGRTYTPAKTVSYEAAIRACAQEAMILAGYKLFEGPVRLTVQAIFERPKSWPKKKLAFWHTSKPDGSNIQKAAEDAMNGIVFKDDSQIASASVIKSYSGDGSARLVVQVEPL